MGFTPKQLDAMSLWQYTVCVEGFKVNQKIIEPLMSDEDFNAASELLDIMPETVT